MPNVEKRLEQLQKYRKRFNRLKDIISEKEEKASKLENKIKAIEEELGEIPEESKENSKEYIKHYEGPLGVFDYDVRDFKFDENGYLRYIGKETDGSKIHIPQGIKNCYWMFYKCKITTPPIIPNSVEKCHSMFEGCRSLIEAPNVPNTATDCRCMFSRCSSLIKAPKIPNGVKYCEWMFEDCTSLRETYDIPNGVKRCAFMFSGCELLRKAPKISNSVEDCDFMFNYCSNEVRKAGEWNIEHRGQSYYNSTTTSFDEQFKSILKNLKTKFETEDYQHNGRSFSSRGDMPITIDIYKGYFTYPKDRPYVKFLCCYTKYAYPNKDWAESFARQNNLDISDVEIEEGDNSHYELRFKVYVDKYLDFDDLNIEKEESSKEREEHDNCER